MGRGSTIAGSLVLFILSALVAPPVADADDDGPETARAHLWTRQFGTSADDAVAAAAVDAGGVYVVGDTRGSLRGANLGSQDGFVRKYSHAGAHLWTRQFGTPDYDSATGVAVDAGGVYVVGYTGGNLTGLNRGETDGFVRKYSHTGTHLWTRQFGTSGSERVTGVAVNATGVYVAGYTDGSLKGPNRGERDGFVRKYSHAGTHLWTRQFGTSDHDLAKGVAVDATGVYVVGYTLGALRGKNRGSWDGFLRRYSYAGEHVWTRQFGTPEDDETSGVALGGGGVYVAGITWGSLRGSNVGGDDGLLRKYSYGGQHVWTRQFGTPVRDCVTAVAVDGTGIYLTGTTEGALRGTNLGREDAYGRKYSHAGAHLWTRQFGSSDWDRGYGVAVDASGVYLAGRTQGSIRGPNLGGLDAFVRKFATG